MIFKLTSAFNGHNIGELFKALLLKFLEQNEDNDDKNNNNNKGIVLDKKDKLKRIKNKCCVSINNKK
jgi:hypothetical protein